jgi:hypothetical protein
MLKKIKINTTRGIFALSFLLKDISCGFDRQFELMLPAEKHKGLGWISTFKPLAKRKIS